MRWDSAPASTENAISAWPKADSVRMSKRTSHGSSDAMRMWPREKERKSVVVRFRFDEQSVRMAHNSDPVRMQMARPSVM